MGQQQNNQQQQNKPQDERRQNAPGYSEQNKDAKHSTSEQDHGSNRKVDADDQRRPQDAPRGNNDQR